MINLSIRKLFLVSAIGFCLSISAVTAVNWFVGTTVAASQEREAILTDTVASFKDLRFDVVEIQQFLTDVSATHEKAGFDDAKYYRDEALSNITRMVKLSPEYREDLNRISEELSQLYKTGEEMAFAYIEQGREAGNAIMKRPTSGFDDASKILTEDLDRLAADLTKKLSESRSELAGTMSTATSLGIVFSVFILVSGIFSYLITYYKILPPLDRLQVSLQELVSGYGDLTRRLPSKGSDEVANIVDQFNAFIHMLHDLIKRVAAVSAPLVDSAKNLSQLSTKSLNDAHAQETETHKVASAVTEMTAAVNEVARNAGTTLEETRLSSEKAMTGQTVVGKAIESINGLAAEVSSSADVIGRLESYSNDIDQILVSIKGIAEQTNLLALNAAIEAARAGEQGRGFAVVADEVRSLAKRTHESTTQIQQMVEHLQKAAREAADVMTRSHEKAQDSVARAAEAGDVLGEITRSVSTIADMSAQIATSAEEQGAVSEEINSNVISINDITRKSVQMAEQTAEAAKGLESLADELCGMVKRFRV